METISSNRGAVFALYLPHAHSIQVNAQDLSQRSKTRKADNCMAIERLPW